MRNLKSIIKTSTLGASGLLALAASACGGDDFDSQMTLSGYRVMGIQASPPEVTPDESIELSVHDFYDGNDELIYNWRVCLFSLGATEGYECFDKALEQDVGSDANITLDLGPDGFGLRALLDALPVIPNEDGSPRSLKRGFDVWVKLESGPDCSKCETIDTVKRVTIRDNADEAPNDNPVIDEFKVTGSRKRGKTITLKVETDSPESFIDPRTGKRDSEEYLYSWYTTEGEADPTRTFGDTQATELELPDKAGEIEVMVAVRDGRGGVAVSRQIIDVE